MIYAVNKQTKEHRLSGTHIVLRENELLVQADADGWIEWSGGECPLPEDQLYEAKSGRGEVCRDDKPQSDNWKTRRIEGIIAYRPILEPQAEQVKEWRGPEDGLPPIGSMVYTSSNGKVRIITHINQDGGPWAAVGQSANFGKLVIGTEESGVFKPIRTDRERWIDQAGSIESCMPDSYQPHELLEALYDAGLAKRPGGNHETP